MMIRSTIPAGRVRYWQFVLVLLSALGLICFSSACDGASGKNATPVPTNGVQQTATQIPPTSTATLLPSATPTPWKKIAQGSGIPAELPVISMDNAAEIEELGRWGNGVAYDMAWSPDGRSLAITTSRYLILLNGETLAIEQRLALDFPLYRIAFSVDGDTLFGGGAQGMLFRYDVPEQTLEALPLNTGSPITALAAGHNHDIVLSADWNQAVYLLNLESGLMNTHFAKTLSGSQAVGFSADDERVFTWSPIEPIKNWDTVTAKMGDEFYFGVDASQHTGSQVRFSADGNAAAVNQQWQVRIQNLNDGTTIGLLKGFNTAVQDLDISADGKWTITLHADQVQVWESAKSRSVATYRLSDPADTPVMVRLSKDGKRIALLGHALSLYGFDQETGEISPESDTTMYLSTDLSFPAQLSAENGIIFVGLDGSLRQLDFNTGEMRFESVLENSPLQAAAASDGLLAVGYANRTIKITDLNGENEYPLIRGLSSVPLQLAIAPQGGLLAAQTGQQASGLWQIENGNYISKQTWDVEIERIVFSPDGRFLIASGGGQTQLYDVENETLSAVVQGRYLDSKQEGMLLETYAVDNVQLTVMRFDSLNVLEHMQEKADQAQYSADESLLAISGRQLRILDAANGEEYLAMPNPAPGAKILFSSDGRLLLLVHADGSMILLGVTPKG